MYSKQILLFEALGQPTNFYLKSSTELNKHLEKFSVKRSKFMAKQQGSKHQQCINNTFNKRPMAHVAHLIKSAEWNHNTKYLEIIV